MTAVGPATETGAPVVPSAPKSAEERAEYLVWLVVESGNGVSPAAWWLTSLRERMSQAAQAWEREVAEAREESREMLAIAHDRIAQLEQTVERLGRDLAAERVACVEFDDRSAMQRRTIAALVEQLAAEMQRGGGA